MIEDIKLHSPDSKLALLIRHADRERIPDGDFGNDVPINEKGQKNAIELGKKLQGHTVNKIFTSPIPRCIQTAEHISRGYGTSLEIVVSKCLGDPGLHVVDESLSGEFYLQHGFDEMYRRFMAREEIPGTRGADAYRAAMTDFLNQNTADKGLTLFITHDSLIAFYDYALRGIVYTKDRWVKYLTGMIIKY